MNRTVIEKFLNEQKAGAAVALTEIKKHLISGEKSDKDKGLSKIMNILLRCKNESDKKAVIVFLITEDIVDLICETMATTNINMLQKVFSCILLLAKHDDFYTVSQYTSIQTAQSLLRTISMLFKQNTSLSATKKALYLLAFILKRITNNRPLTAVCTPDQLLSITMRVLDNPEINYFISVGVEILCLLLQDADQDIRDKLQSATQVLFQALRSIAQESTTVYERSLKIVVLLSQLGASLFIFHSKIKPEDSELWEQVVQCVAQDIIPFLQDECQRIPMHLRKKILKNVFHICVIAPKDLVYSYLAFTLLSQNRFFKLFEVSYYFRKFPEISELMDKIIMEIVCCLARTDLDIEHSWPGGIEDFRKVFSLHLGKLTMKTPNEWFMSKLDTSLFDLIIILFYFQLLANNRSEQDKSYFCALNYYLVKSLKPSPMGFCIPVIKATWFSFCVLYSSVKVEETENVVYMKKAHVKLCNFLATCASIKNIFTPHPAVLTWSYCSPFLAKKIKFDLMVLWLKQCADENGNACYKHVLKLCNENEEARFSLLDIAQKFNEDCNAVLDTTYKLTRDIIRVSSPILREDLTLIVWSSVSNMIKRYISDPDMTCNNVICLLKIALLEVPSKEKCPIALLEQTVDMLPNAVICAANPATKNDIILIHALRYLVILIEYMTQLCSQSNALRSVVSQKRFLNLIARIFHNSAENAHFTFCSTILRLCNCLLHYQQKINTQCDQTIRLKWDSLCSVMSSSDSECVMQAISLFCFLHNGTTIPSCQVVTFDGETSISSLRALYYQLLGKVVQGDPKVTRASLQCMSIVITKHDIVPNMSEYLSLVFDIVCNPWTCFIIRSILLSIKCEQHTMRQFLVFLKDWLAQYVRIHSERKIELVGNGALCSTYLEETVDCISAKIKDIFITKSDNERTESEKEIMQQTEKLNMQ